MIDIRIKNRILSLYHEGDDAYRHVTFEEYKQLFYAIRMHIFGSQEWINAVSMFLIHGAMTYDRFIELRPKYVDNEMYEMFCAFLSTLQRLDGQSYGRTCLFHLDNIQWMIFRDCSLKPRDEELKEILNKHENSLIGIEIPKGNDRIAENLKRKKEYIHGLINDVSLGNIRTKIHTSLPFIFSDTDAIVSLQVDGVNVEVKIINRSQGSSLPGMMIAEGTSLTTSAPSGWMTTCCDLDIQADCLMDGLAKRPSVTLQKEEDGRFWIVAFDFTYHVVTALWMFFQQKENRMPFWPPLPNDIQ
ncbi:MAG: hypothetical protein MJY94_01230 [Bacteroidales bacterium]|nr:hypothetical protein [Bacteroidales bacterium]